MMKGYQACKRKQYKNNKLLKYILLNITLNLENLIFTFPDAFSPLSLAVFLFFFSGVMVLEGQLSFCDELE